MTFLKFFLIWPLVPVSGLRLPSSPLRSQSLFESFPSQSYKHQLRNLWNLHERVVGLSARGPFCSTNSWRKHCQRMLDLWHLEGQDCHHHQFLDSLISMKLRMRNLCCFHCKSYLEKLCTLLGLLCEILNKFYKNNMLGHFIHGFKQHWWVIFYFLFFLSEIITTYC